MIYYCMSNLYISLRTGEVSTKYIFVSLECLAFFHVKCLIVTLEVYLVYSLMSFLMHGWFKSILFWLLRTSDSKPNAHYFVTSVASFKFRFFCFLLFSCLFSLYVELGVSNHLLQKRKIHVSKHEHRANHYTRFHYNHFESFSLCSTTVFCKYHTLQCVLQRDTW